MARARRVRGIRPKESLGENARKVVAVRLDELLSWRAALDDAALVQELHDMRIAAKRLRYALEMFDVCFPNVKPLLKEITGIQEDLGTIHDLDVLTGILRTRLQAIDAATEERAVEIAESDEDALSKGKQLRQLLYAEARDRRRQGLIGLIGDKVGERRRRYAAFREHWGNGSLEELGAQVREVCTLTPRPQSRRQSDRPTEDMGEGESATQDAGEGAKDGAYAEVRATEDAGEGEKVAAASS